MIRKKLYSVGLKLLFVFSVTAHFSLVNFASAADPIATDSRIRTLVYGPNEVFEVITEHGYQSSVEFGADELIQTVSLGDPSKFRVTPAGNKLFIKALKKSQHTNMAVVTNEHTYQFELSSKVESDEDLIYVVRFFYPEDDDFDAPQGEEKNPFLSQSSEILQQNYNFNYSLSGPDAIAPVRVFDDGQYTFFKFSQRSGTPKIHAVNPDGTETPLVTRRDGEYIVVERVMPQFSLHKGKDVVCIFNDSLLSSEIKGGRRR